MKKKTTVEDPHPQLAPVKARTLELVEIVLSSLQKHGPNPMLAMAGPLLKMEMAKEKNETLLSFLTCLTGISAAVCDWGSSQEEYEARVEPHIRALIALLEKK